MRKVEYRVCIAAAKDSSVLHRFFRLCLFPVRYVLFGKAWL